MDVFLLGAGKPALGQKPSALKNIAYNTRAMDWQIHSFESVATPADIHYLGGYYVDDVIAAYPQLNFTVIPDWQKRTILHTFLKAPFSGEPVIVSYSDTIFRQEIIAKMLSIDADVIFCIDSLWKERYESRTKKDIQSAETILVKSATDESHEVEFTGLMYFNNKAATLFSNIIESDVGSNLIHLLNHLEDKGLSIKPFDVAGHWAEFNSPHDIAQFILGTKAETLARLEPLVKKSHIGKQVNFTTTQWRKNSSLILNKISNCFSGANLIIRSSAKDEDNWHSSNAGNFESLLNIDINDETSISKAIDTVIASYGSEKSSENQILIQHFLHNVRAAGVVFTCSLESGAPYYRFNFDDKTQSTESVTAGGHGDLRTIILSRFSKEHLKQIEPLLVPVLEAIQELEQLLNFDRLDIEFAIDDLGQVHIFQVRPVTVDHSKYELELESIKNSLEDSILRFRTQQLPSPFVSGNKTLFANMPDWNPAEIIGTHPKPLAFSLYHYLLTNDIWAQQRTEFGYRDVRPSPLILLFSGQPYVDARASLNSFIPVVLPKKTIENIATAYINILSDNPQYHDKIEFEVAFTIWTPNFIEHASSRLIPYGISPEEIEQLEDALKNITLKALTRLHDDIKSIDYLNQRRLIIDSSKLPVIDKIFSMLNDCKRFGTLAFSHAARAGFVATTLLKSFVTEDIITEEQRLFFLKSINTVTGDIEKDRCAYNESNLSKQQLINKYGHLRPGTYEVTTQAYWEDPSRYLISENKSVIKNKIDFKFSQSATSKLKKMLQDLGSPLSVQELKDYLVAAIQARESVKFEFTKNLSRSLDLCVELGASLGLNREELSYLEYHNLEQLKLNAISTPQLKEQLEKRKQNYALTSVIELPSLIQKEIDFYCFERFTSQPNFVTLIKIEAPIQQLNTDNQDDLYGKLVLIPQADPGYDWLFAHGISGLITQFGGANSHMTIRAAELNLPAAIGVGEKLYEKIIRMRRIELDCANHTIREIQ